MRPRQRRSSREQEAFEHYLRWGRQPDPASPLGFAFAQKSLSPTPPTSYYTWRTAQDERVRASHAANDGQVFAWNDPPSTGHPGHERNCRCWAEPYYGTPFISDTTLPLNRQQRTDTSGREPWQLIETLTRPDGSLAESRFLMRDGTRIVSTFNGGLVVNEVTLPNGKLVRVVRKDGVQSVYVGASQTPVVMSEWTPNGPRIALPRTRVAHDTELPQLSLDDLPRLPGIGMPAIETVRILRDALVDLYNAATAAPADLGATQGSVAAVAFRVWDSGNSTIPFALAALTAEQVAQICKRLPEVQAWTTEAAIAAGPIAQMGSPQAWGTAVHWGVERRIVALKKVFPSAYANIFAEISFDPDAGVVGRGAGGSTRLDILENVGSTVCVYDIKTGNAKLTPGRIEQIRQAVTVHFGSATFIIVEVRPFE